MSNNWLSSLSRHFGAIGVWGAALCLAGLVCLAGTGNAYAAGPGPDACKNCHAAAVASYTATAHGQKGNAKAPDCSGCHGDGTAHVKASGGKGSIKSSKTMAPDEKNESCLACHAAGSKRSHWEGSTHQARGTACTSCHTMHATDRVLTKLTQPQVCFTCHAQQRAEVNRTFRHPVLEGKVACSDCHNVHGSISKALMKRDSVVETCFQCHAEKRGPFVHSHEPVAEDCSLCHNPHGTVTDSMLKVRQPFLCHQCHTPHGGVIAQARGQSNTTTFPGMTAPQLTGTTSMRSAIYVTQGRGCVNCHTQIHGGNNPGFTPTPQFMFR